MSMKCAILLCNRGTETLSEQIQECKDKGADLVELRLDIFLNTDIVPPTGQEAREVEGTPPDEGEVNETGNGKETAKADVDEPENAETPVVELLPEDKVEGSVSEETKIIPEDKVEGSVSEETEIIPEDKVEGSVSEETEIIPEDTPEVIVPPTPPEIRDLEKIIKESPLPLICTLRSEEIGGVFDGEPEEKIEKLRQIIQYTPAYIEFELDEIQRDKEYVKLVNEAKENNIKVIISKHNMEECYVEDEIEYIMKSMVDLGCDISKICCKITGFTNIANIFSSAHELKKGNNSYTFKGTGKLGNKCSVYAPLLGSTIAYCSQNKEERAEKHLIDLDSLNQQWHILLGKRS